MKGREPIFRGVNERVIRLSGNYSDVTELSLQNYKHHILPIYESYHKAKYLIEKYSRDLTIPIYWRVKNGSYGKSRVWANLKIQREWFLDTKDGKKVFVVEADASIGEEALALVEEKKMDLDN